mmetsp:Transcript_108361/g.170928  ORF Transcript_108361/g.170928 Transcript_108361/m.170928 type:complete len:508 (+) Transcript_108361:54-1577(+)
MKASRSAKHSAFFLCNAKEGTWLVLRLVACWSAASHLACSVSHKGLLSEGGVPEPGEAEEPLEEMFPFEPLWDLLLPVLGLSVGAFGVRLTLALSFVEPLLLLAMPLTRELLHNFHGRLLSWHLGGIFGHPMLVAQLAVSRSESFRPDASAAALGSLVGAYAVGALAGAVMRRSLLVWHWSLFPGFQQSLVLLLVLANLRILWLRGDIISHGHSHSHGDDSEDSAHSDSTHHSFSSAAIFHLESTPLLQAANTDMTTALAAWCMWPCSKAVDGLIFAGKEIWHVLRIGFLSSDVILARGLILFSFSAIVSPIPIPRVDLLANTPLHHGFGVLWFDIAGICTSALIVPAALGGPFKLNLQQCLGASISVAVVACAATCFASLHAAISTFAMAMFAGIALGVCSAFASAVLSLRIIRRASKGEGSASDAAVALGWGLFATGVGQQLGAQVGDGLFLHKSWFGVAAMAGMACVLAWCMTTLFPDEDKQLLPMRPAIGSLGVLGVALMGES